jgi:hypothetical protein
MRLTWVGLLAALPSLAAAQPVTGLPSGPATGPASAPATLPVRRPGEYLDSLHGFALTPPPQTERTRETSPSRLVAWVRRDAKTNAVRWTLEVLRTVHQPTTLPAADYAKALAEELIRTGQFKVESTGVGTVAGRTAMNLKGVLSTGPVTLWRVQTWVQVSPRENLILSISGLLTEKQELENILATATDSLRLFDPTAILQARRDSLQRGGDLLGALTETQVRGALYPEPTYFVVEMGGQRVGFLKVTESWTVREKVPGVLVIRLGAVKVPQEPLRLSREEIFATPDRTVERWKRTLVEGSGSSALRTVQEAEKTGTAMRVRTARGNQRPQSDQRDFPEAVRGAYLPLAFDVLAARLVDRTRPGDWGFAVYNPESNDFEMRTIQVVGPEAINVAGKRVPAVRMTDQMGMDAPLVNLWVDARGTILRMETGEGLLLERSERKVVVADFAAEVLELEKLSP